MPSISIGPNIQASSQIVDGAIMNADINAAAAIALSKLAAGTQGGIMHRTVAGVMTELAAGSTGQVLTSQGAGADPVWGAAGAVTKGFVSYNTNTTVTHGLGSTPTKIRIVAYTSSLNGGYRQTKSEGFAVIAAGTVTSSAAICITDPTEGTPANNLGSTTTTGRVALFGFQGAAYVTLSSVTSTQFTLTITAGSESAIIHNVIWEAYA